MDGMGKQRRPRRAFTAEFKAEIVEVCRRGDRSVGQVAKDFDLTETAVRDWVRQAEIDAGVRTDGLTSAEREELTRLRRENRRLAEDVEILKRASGFLREGDPVTVYPFIEAEKSQQRNAAQACVLLKVSRSAFYADRAAGASQREQVDAELTEAIAAVHDESGGTYGAPRVHAELADQGRRHGRKRIARLMRAAGRHGRTPRRWRTTTVPDPIAALPADLIGRDFTTATTALDARWCGDITYIHTWQGWLYLATVIDLGSRRVVGWATADHLRTELIDQALTTAVASHRPPRGLIFHSDRGGQYTSAQYRRLADQHGVRLSVGRRGQCWDNAVAESFFATIKTELLDRRAWPTRAAAHKAIFNWIEGWYNTRRRHSTLDYFSPAAFEARITQQPGLRQVA